MSWRAGYSLCNNKRHIPLLPFSIPTYQHLSWRVKFTHCWTIAKLFLQSQPTSNLFCQLPIIFSFWVTTFFISPSLHNISLIADFSVTPLLWDWIKTLILNYLMFAFPGHSCFMSLPHRNALLGWFNRSLLSSSYVR